MTTCDEARSAFARARERAAHESEVMSGYQETKSNLEDEHSNAARRVDDATGNVVTNEREWDADRQALRTAVEAKQKAKEKLAYWTEQRRRLDNGETTDYSSESNEGPIIVGGRDRASSADYHAEQERQSAEDKAREAKSRFERSQQFLQERANDTFAIEDKQSTLRNRIGLQRSAVSEAEDWVRNAERTVNEVC